MRALIVDDCTTIRLILRNALAKAGFPEVVEATNGVEALIWATDPRVKLILMDWHMPEMNGLEAVKALRAAGNKTPIIMVTTEGEKKHVIEVLLAGANDYLLKPFTPDELAAKVKKHVQFDGVSAGAPGQAATQEPSLQARR